MELVAPLLREINGNCVAVMLNMVKHLAQALNKRRWEILRFTQDDTRGKVLAFISLSLLKVKLAKLKYII